MSKPKAEPVKAPFQQQQQQTQQQVNTYAPFSVADTQEGKAFLSAPLDYGSETSVDPVALSHSIFEPVIFFNF